MVKEEGEEANCQEDEGLEVGVLDVVSCSAMELELHDKLSKTIFRVVNVSSLLANCVFNKLFCTWKMRYGIAISYFYQTLQGCLYNSYPEM